MTGGVQAAGSAGAVTPAFGGLTVPYQQRVLGRGGGADGIEDEDEDGMEGGSGALGATAPLVPPVSAKPPRGGAAKRVTKATPASATARSVGPVLDPTNEPRLMFNEP